jgi:hypothetical protein
MSEPYPGLEKIIHLKHRQHWPSALDSLIHCLGYRTYLLLGKSKTELIRNVVQHVLAQEAAEPGGSVDDLQKSFQALQRKEIAQAKVTQKYAQPVPDLLIAPEEALRRLRYFSEDYLNREFDLFLSLLPDTVLDGYFSSLFSLRPGGSWNVLANSPEFEVSREESFMQPDTLAYNATHGVLIALELKIDAPLQNNQVLSYCRMAAGLEAAGLVDPGTDLKMLVIGSDATIKSYRPETVIAKAQARLASEPCPWRCPAEEASRREKQAARFLSALELRFTSWQALGDYFEANLQRSSSAGWEQSYAKLVDGFLNSLAEKYSQRSGCVLYNRKVR